jgi:hypothetical protein
MREPVKLGTFTSGREHGDGLACIGRAEQAFRCRS